MITTCLYCGIKFESHCSQKRKYCSRVCSSESKKQEVTITCLECNSLFSVKNYMKDRTKFCSSKCYGIYNSKNPGILQPIRRQRKVTKECLRCKIKFKVHKYRKENSNFCSKDCYDNYRRDILICLHCGVKFTAPHNEKRKYCSQQCSKNRTYNSSMGEQEIKHYLVALGYKISDTCVMHNTGFYRPDIVIENKIIEFYGTYWHCHESMFEENDFNHSIRMTATEKRDFDKIRTITLEKNGYHVYVIWEHEYNENKNETLQSIVKFLENET